MPPRKYETPEILHDAPLHEKKMADFHFDDFAATLARLIASPNTDTPLVIGINGAWGSGKTSLLLRVKNMLDKPTGIDSRGAHRFANVSESFRRCKTVWFDAWKYNEEEALLVALVRVILQEMKKDKLMDRLNGWFEDVNQPSYDLIAMFVNAFELSFGGLGLGLKFKADPQKHATPSLFEQHTAFFDYFNDAFERLLALWVHGRTNLTEIQETQGALVVFIDDLDRCLPSKTVQALEALKLFLDKSGCVFVLGADIKIVQAAVETHYKNAGIIGESARDYLEKIIQLRFDIPPIFEAAMEKYLRSQDKPKIDDAMLNRWRALVAAAEVNPRRVKNVINDLNLQWFMAVNSDQASGVNRDDFICWQALMRASPAKFVRQVMSFEDKALRFNFVMDALKWQQGKSDEREAVQGFFSNYEDDESRRLRKVLKQISFLEGFTPDVLEALIYMIAPPIAVANAGGILSEETSSTPSLPLEEQEFTSGKTVEFTEGNYSRHIEPLDGSVLTADQNRWIVGGMELVRVPAGKFVMGSKDDDELAYDSEKPQHTVEINYDYWIARNLVTNQQYSESLGKKKHPVVDWLKKKSHPVVDVSWDDAVDYCKWFNESCKSELGDLVLRLTTEAEWEKAARGAYGNEWPWGNEFEAGKCNSAEGRMAGTTPVGAYSSAGGDSPYGCADMAGNVWEWCRDWYDEDEYAKTSSTTPVVNPFGPETGIYHVLRGGSFGDFGRNVRSARRMRFPYDRGYLIGFRVCIAPNL